ncbi:DNA-binding transcriptional LysR family regulator [Paenibacillus phyllosphaerae]|uniref:DNA-binding transcriptional LysR family regulator n=1 Tax=Paenibacillus phyllosphaerae TaxID=274593 RepID=A0A7W5FLB9_9BACL|nr:LysR substrate-binding domain-containing protein [Paenibacillus phyllosphaerae]MBB3108854.1 DNA-binding transcriptional LysR family regulator [Paenibacillus phyllosphaerae]
MELLQLHYFRVAAKYEHMTKAAEELKIAQPSLSKTISRLEEHVGVPLFDRQGRNIRLSSFGKVFLERVERAFRELEEGKREVRDMAGLNRGSVSLAASISNVIPELLAAFLELYPSVHIRQVLEPRAGIKRMIEDGQIDLCLTTAPLEGEDFEWRPLITMDLFVCVPDNHRLAGRDSVSLIELKDESFIGLRTGYFFRDMTDNLCMKAGFTPNTMIEVDESEASLLLLRRGLGITFLSELGWSKRAHLVPNKLRIEDPDCTVTIGLAWSKRHYLSFAAQRFQQFVIEFYAQLEK